MPVDFDLIKNRFKKLRQNVARGERAPHKPLLVLLALSRYKAGSPRLMSFSEVEEQLKRLIENFGPMRKSYKPENPFWHLQTDGLWELSLKRQINEPGSPSAKKLRDAYAEGGFTEEVFKLLSSDESLINRLASAILEQYFPETFHEEIMSEIGLDLKDSSSSYSRTKRDPEFRQKILSIYEYRCAICGFNMRLNNNPICIEAAHIMWHQVGGPAIEQNGIALCSMHHKMFDRGAFTINNCNEVKVSRLINGNQCIEDWLWKFDRKPLLLPRTKDNYPKGEFISWHLKEVFKDYPS